MPANLLVFPLAFWGVIALLIVGTVRGVNGLRHGFGIPMLTVLITVGVWYVGDALYNDYSENHVKLFSAPILNSAWWQVAWFLTVFIVLVPYIHKRYNARFLRRSSGIIYMFQKGVDQAAFQNQLKFLFKVCFAIWVTLSLIAAIRLGSELPYYFFPFLGYKAEPWGRGRLGTGFDALLSLAVYFQILVAGMFGIVAGLATNPRTRALAGVCCLLAWPYFIFDRSRYVMLATVIPGLLSWVVLRIRGGIIKKALLLACCFIVVNAWMAFVIANRSTMSITAALSEKGFSLKEKEKGHHEGLNMYEELCWISQFIEQGTYKVNWGTRYFADLVNPIPRVLWPGKPMIGMDYAVARGQGGADASFGGVNATISTGLVGQGVVNFGRFLGPAFVAFLMSLWVAVLARLDLNMEKVGRIPLYAIGLILTFTLGRDITFIACYPFVIGWLAIWWMERRRFRRAKNADTHYSLAGRKRSATGISRA